MDYVYDLCMFFYSYYVLCGICIVIGVIGLMLFVLLVMDLQGVMVVLIGVLCMSFMDLFSLLWYKFNEMMVCVLLIIVVMFFVVVVMLYVILLVVIVVVSFFVGLMVVYGNKMMLLQFVVFFVMMFIFIEEFVFCEVVEYILQFFFGVIGYMVFVMVVVWGQWCCIKEQVLVECFYELVVYVECKVGFYDVFKDFDEQFNVFVCQQILVVDKQQVVCDFVFCDNCIVSDGCFVQIYMWMFDIYEYLLLFNIDYFVLCQWLVDVEVMCLLCDVIECMCLDIEGVVYVVGCDWLLFMLMLYDQEMVVIEGVLYEL